MAEISPMMKQYMKIKSGYKDSILFFRLGDFYEMFFDDAKVVSEELDLTLTGKDYGQKERAPMCGIPYHSCESYIARLVSKGYKVAMCDQMENPATAKGLVKREVVRVITPGTVMEESMLDEAKNNYICSVLTSENEEEIGACFCDISTGILYATELKGDKNYTVNQLKNELGKFSPSEILIGSGKKLGSTLESFLKGKLPSCRAEFLEQNEDFINAKNMLIKQFGKERLKKINIESREVCVISIGNLLGYLKKTQKSGIERINSINFYNKSEFMGLDINTIRNLEITETMRTKSKKGSLLWVLDKTKTSMGKRLLRSWIERPLVDIQKITWRQDAVEELVNDIALKDDFAESLSGIHDIERLMTKITYGSANARDLKSLSSTLSKLPQIKFNLYKCKSYFLSKMCENLDLLKEVYMLIEDSIIDDPPMLIKEGGIIKEKYSEEVDRLRSDIKNGKTLIADIESRERQKTSIPKLKIGYNKIFGYYIEVTNSFKNLVPEEYIRKQTLTNCERYITQELKDLEARILYAKDKINEIEYEIFEKVRLKVAEQLPKIAKTANIIANLDVIVSLAETACFNNYVKPQIHSGKTIFIKEGRHPVVEQLLNDAPFVPNDTLLDNDENMVSVITGPNMAGKSTYMRQTALITLMAQIGSFVPATQAKIGIVDNIFTRIGASDDLASGQSTFMVEMNEVADIIKNATSNSLLILDEIGRGTSTFDGMSIARAVLEYISNPKTLGAKTLFATHYHELTSMSGEFNNIKNYNIAVKKRGDDITFLRRIVPGGADDSYGIEVAKLAGLPQNIINRSKDILKMLESNKYPESKSKNEETKDVSQLTFKDSYTNANEILNKLKNIDVSVLTPVESMNILYGLVEMTKK
ncbi:MAG: DNA mismatch repair protein MutS [Clostridia bacterium]|nr:DNA mismatch repair protein MutS [Clostridia bacterium]